MEAQIWRLPLSAERDSFVSVPKGSRPLSVAMKGNEPQLYIFVPDTEAEKIERLVFVIPTGVSFRPEELNAQFVGTFAVTEHFPGTDVSNVLVFHVLMEPVRPEQPRLPPPRQQPRPQSKSTPNARTSALHPHWTNLLVLAIIALGMVLS